LSSLNPSRSISNSASRTPPLRRLGDLRVKLVQEMPAGSKTGERVGHRLELALAQTLPDGARGPRHPDQDRADRQAHRRSTDPHELLGREQPQRDQPKNIATSTIQLNAGPGPLMSVMQTCHQRRVNILRLPRRSSALAHHGPIRLGLTRYPGTV
jgi:hypothetical protein